MSRVLHWNGRDIPTELKELKPGTYVLEAIDEVPELTEDEEEGLRAALRSLDAGAGRPIEGVRAAVDSALKR